MTADPSSRDHRKSRIIELPEVTARTGYSKSKIYRDMKAGKFPQQAKRLQGSTSAGWFEDDIDAFLEQRRPDSNPSGNCPPTNDKQCDGVSDPKNARHSVHPNFRSGMAPQPKEWQSVPDATLIRTGMKLHGQDVFCHVPSRKLLVVVGSMSDEWLRTLGNVAA